MIDLMMQIFIFFLVVVFLLSGFVDAYTTALVSGIVFSFIVFMLFIISLVFKGSEDDY